ncbi:hypothetical protein [Methanobrevibacter sp.]|uniref:hypothetical protein n=1 Tax=Methanobrevibacter sp. TaxID=66852 RepID=UPI0025E56E67|nr:hypothetical protein [Methanobrevibacter sp.]MBQ2832405.1 hypothetical protein [Methanobrevibacter sp.]
MRCIYEKTFQQTSQGDVRSIIPHMFEIVNDGKIDDYAHVSFPRAYFSDVIEALCRLRFKLEKDKTVSCELHTVRDKIHLEFVKQ